MSWKQDTLRRTDCELEQLTISLAPGNLLVPVTREPSSGETRRGRAWIDRTGGVRIGYTFDDEVVEPWLVIGQRAKDRLGTIPGVDVGPQVPFAGGRRSRIAADCPAR
jgi:hypothetical protein